MSGVSPAFEHHLQLALQRVVASPVFTALSRRHRCVGGAPSFAAIADDALILENAAGVTVQAIETMPDDPTAGAAWSTYCCDDTIRSLWLAGGAEPPATTAIMIARSLYCSINLLWPGGLFICCNLFRDAIENARDVFSTKACRVMQAYGVTVETLRLWELLCLKALSSNDNGLDEASKMICSSAMYVIEGLCKHIHIDATVENLLHEFDRLEIQRSAPTTILQQQAPSRAPAMAQNNNIIAPLILNHTQLPDGVASGSTSHLNALSTSSSSSSPSSLVSDQILDNNAAAAVTSAKSVQPKSSRAANPANVIACLTQLQELRPLMSELCYPTMNLDISVADLLSDATIGGVIPSILIGTAELVHVYSLLNVNPSSIQLRFLCGRLIFELYKSKRAKGSTLSGKRWTKLRSRLGIVLSDFKTKKQKKLLSKQKKLLSDALKCFVSVRACPPLLKCPSFTSLLFEKHATFHEYIYTLERALAQLLKDLQDEKKAAEEMKAVEQLAPAPAPAATNAMTDAWLLEMADKIAAAESPPPPSVANNAPNGSIGFDDDGDVPYSRRPLLSYPGYE